MSPSFILALALMVAPPPPADDGGEPLPPGAPTDAYELSAWCYGALGEYLQIYEAVKPELRDIDNMFGGDPVKEDEPYQSDMAAARDELKLIGESVTLAEKASPKPIAERGVAAMRQGEAIWSVAEAKTRRELARAWMLWALPDRCDSNARELAQRSAVLGKALSYNADLKPPALPTHELPPPTRAADQPTSPAAPPSPAYSAPTSVAPRSQAAQPTATAAAPQASTPPAPPPEPHNLAPAPQPAASEAPSAASPPLSDNRQPPAAAPTPPPAPAATAAPPPPNADQSQEPAL